jgi:hypothetical protein
VLQIFGFSTLIVAQGDDLVLGRASSLLPVLHKLDRTVLVISTIGRSGVGQSQILLRCLLAFSL